MSVGPPVVAWYDRVIGSMDAIWRVVGEGLVRLASAKLGYVAGALALYIVSLFISGFRWRGFIRALGGHVGVLRATLATLGGIAVGNLVPSSRLGGEAVRITLARDAGHVSWRQATVAAGWDRLSEIPPILVLILMSGVAVTHLIPAWPRSAVVALMIAISVLLVGGGAAARRWLGPRWSRWREALAADRVGGSVMAAGVALSSAVWLQDVARLACATRAFGLSLSLTQLAALSVIAMLGGLVPSAGGVGPVEGGLLAGLISFGADLPTAAAVTAVERAISLGFSTASGAAVVGIVGGRSLWSAARSGKIAERTVASTSHS
jgi:uncharacterized membrane protein YbhN (UPF0104 family)